VSSVDVDTTERRRFSKGSFTMPDGLKVLTASLTAN
jgi:hypothetical protein